MSPTVATSQGSATTSRGRVAPRRASAADQSKRASAASQPRRASAVRWPRRVSGPAGGRSRAVPAPRTGVALGGRALAVVRGLPEHSVIDRLVRSQLWIPVLGVLLAGIVAMQVEILKVGTSMGRSIQHSTALQSQNELLQANVAGLSDEQRIERLAAGMGMVMPSPTEDVFLTAHPGGDAGRAVANIYAPDPTGFAAQLAAQIQTAAALMPSSSGTPQSGAASGTSSDLTPGQPAAGGAATATATGGQSSAATTSAPAGSETTSAQTQPAPGTATASGAASAPGTATASAAATAPGTGTGGAAGAGPTLATGAAAPSSSQSGGAASG